MTVAPSQELVDLAAAERTRDLLAEAATEAIGAVGRFTRLWAGTHRHPPLKGLSSHHFSCLAEEAEMALRGLERAEAVVQEAVDRYRA